MKDIKLIKRQIPPEAEESIIIEYIEWTEEMEDICGYIEGKKCQIIGYDENKNVYPIKMDEILYFEAVGELVFAYTKTCVYEIKMRLYQVENTVKYNNILRASKSFLINVKKIEIVRPILNGRFMATMVNGEEVLISRHYAKAVTEAIKHI